MPTRLKTSDSSKSNALNIDDSWATSTSSAANPEGGNPWQVVGAIVDQASSGVPKDLNTANGAASWSAAQGGVVKSTYDTVETTAGGYGAPSTGTYSVEAVSTDEGYKSFGTTGQGTSSYGTRDTSSARCSERIIYVSVSVTGALLSSGTTAEVQIQAGNFEFVEDLTPDSSSTTDNSSNNVVNTEESAGTLVVNMMAILSLMAIALMM